MNCAKFGCVYRAHRGKYCMRHASEEPLPPLVFPRKYEDKPEPAPPRPVKIVVPRRPMKKRVKAEEVPPTPRPKRVRAPKPSPPKQWTPPTTIHATFQMIRWRGRKFEYETHTAYWYRWPIILHMPPLARILTKAGFRLLKRPQAKSMAVFVHDMTHRTLSIFEGELCLEKFKSEKEYGRALRVFASLDGRNMPNFPRKPPKHKKESVSDPPKPVL